jgi:class 3 adenylate cyclase
VKAEFNALVERLGTAGDGEKRAIEAGIWERFGVERAVMALDMSHFSLTIRRSGILRCLALIRRMQAFTRPLVERCGGIVVEFHADNLMAVFPDVDQAVEAGVLINRGLAKELNAEGKQEISVAIGIDFGRFLFVANEHCYGDTVNVAFKLGEDIARSGEILITDGARARLRAGFAHRLTSQPVTISGLELSTHNVRYEPEK